MSSQVSGPDISDLPPIVLLVEDDPATLDRYTAYFESKGVWVSSSTHPDEVLTTIDELKPDVIVTDLGFGDRALVDGASFVHAVKSQAASRAIPIIVLAGTEASRASEQRRGDASVWFVKPVLPSVLLGNIRRLLTTSAELRACSERVRARTLELTSRSLHSGTDRSI